MIVKDPPINFVKIDTFKSTKVVRSQYLNNSFTSSIVSVGSEASYFYFNVASTALHSHHIYYLYTLPSTKVKLICFDY